MLTAGEGALWMSIPEVYPQHLLPSPYPFQQVGVDEGKHYHANAFDPDYDVPVLPHAPYITLASFVDASRDPYALVLPESLLRKNLAPGITVGGQHTEKVDGILLYHLYLIAAGITVNPERNRYFRMLPALFLKEQCIAAGRPDKQNTWDESLLLSLFPRLRNGFLGKEHLIAERT